jgi:uncharacterized protein YqeY
MLKEKIDKDFITAFKAKDSVTKNLLSVVKGEITTIEKNTGQSPLPDADVIKILSKVSKNLKETIDQTGDESSKVELAIIEAYLPKQMSKDEITSKVSSLVNAGVVNIGAIMKEFASLPADKKIVSEVIKELVK